MNRAKVLVFVLAIAGCRGHVSFWNTPNNLTPVQGLYVKPSSDGTTGDLYVAATEDSGVKSQWLTTDQAVNFLPMGAHQSALPLTYSSSVSTTSLPHDESLVTTQKRAVVTSPTFKYAYMPLPTAEGSAASSAFPYPYAAVSATPTTTEATPGCGDVAQTPTYPQYTPYQYYYPQMLASFASAVNALKEAGVSEEKVSATAAQAASMWPYSYPVQYVMVNPTAWTQSQTPAPVQQTTPAPTTEATSSEEN